MCIRLTDRKIEKISLDVTRSNSFYTRRGTVLFHLAFPYLNLFHAAYGNQSRIGGGFMGLALGVDYFYKNSMFLNLSGGGIVDFMLPFPVPDCYGSGMVNRQSSVYGSLSNNHMLLRNRLSVGYGFSFSHDTWNTIDYGPTEEEKSEGLPWQDATCYRSSNALGVILRRYYYTRGSFFLGLSYRPTFIQFPGGPDAGIRARQVSSSDSGSDK